ncbi:MAG: transglycosylase SLT domain-containing protein [Deltaproteobacteria bacterium]|nr:transglycosylase SLT domain-containing protein [Deltaproteobacteria bacterium]
MKKNFLQGYRAVKSGQPDRAIASLEPIRDLDVGMRDYVLYYLGKAYLQREECPKARRVFRELVGSYPESRWVGAARYRQSHCPSPEGPEEKSRPVLCEDFSLMRDRAECFFSRREYQKAKDLYASLSVKPDGDLRLNDLMRLSQSATRSQDYESALKANDRIRELYPQTVAARTALHNIAYLYQVSGQYREAILLIESFLEEAASSRERRRWLQKTGWGHYRLGEWSKAALALEGSLQEEETAFSLYWRGRALGKLGKKKEAREIYASLADRYPATYYAIRALSQLHGSPPKRYLKKWWPGTVSLHWTWEKIPLEPSDDLEKINLLKWLGLESDAAVETRRVRAERHYLLPDDVGEIKRKGDYFIIPLRLPRTEHFTYRLPHADFLFSQVKTQGGLDPFFLYALMRQESHFRESVVSPVGAIGLLQLLPTTAEGVAMKAGWPFFEEKWLYEPMTNIELAVLYIGKLSQDFEDRWYLVAAAYNAGEGVVSRWNQAWRRLPEEEFIEEIPYEETRDYVKKIYTNWTAYRWIYR